MEFHAPCVRLTDCEHEAYRGFGDTSRSATASSVGCPGFEARALRSAAINRAMSSSRPSTARSGWVRLLRGAFHPAAFDSAATDHGTHDELIIGEVAVSRQMIAIDLHARDRTDCMSDPRDLACGEAPDLRRYDECIDASVRELDPQRDRRRYATLVFEVEPIEQRDFFRACACAWSRFCGQCRWGNGTPVDIGDLAIALFLCRMFGRLR